MIVLQVLWYMLILCLTAYLGYKVFTKYIFFKKHNKLLFVKHSYLKYIILLLACVIVSFGLFDIKRWNVPIDVESNGVDIVFVLDVSKSMNALDFKEGNSLYGRLDAAKSLISNFVASHSEDRVGLIVFAWDAISMSPLTLDHDTFLTFLHNVDYRNLTVQGSNIEKALSLAVDRFATSEERSKVIITISDGWDEEDVINSQFLSSLFTKQNIINFVVGIGTTNWAKIPVGQSPFGEIYYQTYQNQEVVTYLNDGNLKQIAKSIDWEYLQIKTLQDLSKFNNQIDTLEKKALDHQTWKEKQDGRRNLAIVGMIIFSLYLLLFFWEDNLLLKLKKIWKR